MLYGSHTFSGTWFPKQAFRTDEAGRTISSKLLNEQTEALRAKPSLTFPVWLPSATLSRRLQPAIVQVSIKPCQNHVSKPWFLPVDKFTRSRNSMLCASVMCLAWTRGWLAGSWGNGWMNVTPCKAVMPRSPEATSSTPSLDVLKIFLKKCLKSSYSTIDFWGVCIWTSMNFRTYI